MGWLNRLLLPTEPKCVVSTTGFGSQVLTVLPQRRDLHELTDRAEVGKLEVIVVDFKDVASRRAAYRHGETHALLKNAVRISTH